MDLQHFASRLRQAREERGIIQQTVAEILELPRTAITQIENGKRAVSTLELTKLAKLYRQPLSYFIEETSLEEDVEILLYRAAPDLNENLEIKEQINHWIDLCREGIKLENLLQQSPRVGPPTYTVNIPRNKGEAVEQGQAIAEQERKRLGLSILPVANLPELIASQGIWVATTNLPDTISGLFLNNKKIGLIILVNAEHVNTRKRFSYAHEYAHALLDRENPIKISNTDSRDELVEIRANAFAATFLMPEDGVNEFLHGINKGKPSKSENVIFDELTGARSETENRCAPYSQTLTYTDIAIVANHFGVSYQAAVYRLRSLGFFSAKECEQLISQYSDGKKFLEILGMFSDAEEYIEKNISNRELKNQVARLAIEAYRREEISRGRIFELGKAIGIEGEKLFELAQAAFSSIKNNKNGG